MFGLLLEKRLAAFEMRTNVVSSKVREKNPEHASADMATDAISARRFVRASLS